jgi:hypothetical protein
MASSGFLGKFFIMTIFQEKAISIIKGVPDGIKGVFEGALETNNTSQRLVTNTVCVCFTCEMKIVI